jgi:hypothetical protein
LPFVFGYAASAVEPAAAQGPEIKIQVGAKCEGGDAQFEIVNVGETWPRMAMISLLRADDHTVISQRKMRMAAGQRTVFRAREAPDAIGVALWVEPEWYKRDFAFDAAIHCE